MEHSKNTKPIKVGMILYVSYFLLTTQVLWGAATPTSHMARLVIPDSSPEKKPVTIKLLTREAQGITQADFTIDYEKPQDPQFALFGSLFGGDIPKPMHLMKPGKAVIKAIDLAQDSSAHGAKESAERVVSGHNIVTSMLDTDKINRAETVEAQKESEGLIADAFTNILYRVQAEAAGRQLPRCTVDFKPAHKMIDPGFSNVWITKAQIQPIIDFMTGSASNSKIDEVRFMLDEDYPAQFVAYRDALKQMGARFGAYTELPHIQSMAERAYQNARNINDLRRDMRNPARRAAAGADSAGASPAAAKKRSLKPWLIASLVAIPVAMIAFKVATKKK